MLSILELIIGWNYKLGKVDPMEHIGRYRVRCNGCGRLYASRSRFAGACRICTVIREERDSLA